MIVDVGHPVCGQGVVIGGSKEPAVANLDGVSELGRELAEELIESAQELLGGEAVALKLKQEGAGMGLEVGFAIGREHQVNE